MFDIKEFMTQDHRDCDELFALLEETVSEGSSDVEAKFEKFYDDLTNHFKMEEMILFPMLGEFVTISNNPLRAMEMEHEQMRVLLSKMRKAAEKMDKESFFSLSETLMLLMQQHNIKEEQLIYTMANEHLADEASYVISQMRSIAY